MVDTPLDALAIAPHPDDAEMCCGGTLAKLVSLGHRVGILDLTQGELASNGSPEERALEASQAASVLGLSFRANLKLPDGFLMSMLASDSPELGHDGPVSQIIDVIRTTRPSVVFAPSMAARHPDHIAAAQLVNRAQFLSGVKNYPSATPSPPFRPKRLLRYLLRVGLSPDFVVDISDFHHLKSRALNCYQSQVVRQHHTVSTLANAPQSHHALEARDAVFGGLIGVRYAEGFTLDETIHIDDPVSHFAQAQPATLFQD